MPLEAAFIGFLLPAGAFMDGRDKSNYTDHTSQTGLLHVFAALSPGSILEV